MADTQHEGASYSEQILEAARFNNTELLSEIIERITNSCKEEESAVETIAKAINESHDALGNTALHIASFRGNYEALDVLLDQHGVEVDPRNKLDGDTPLHMAVRYAAQEPEHGTFIAEELIDAGADVRSSNNAGFKPIDLVTKNEESDKLLQLLQSAEYAIVAEREEAQKLQELAKEEELDEGSASESDDD